MEILDTMNCILTIIKMVHFMSYVFYNASNFKINENAICKYKLQLENELFLNV